MVKKMIFLNLIITLIILSLNAQVFVHQGSKWYFDYKNFWIEGYVKISYISDTIINNKTTHKLKKELFFYDFLQQEYGYVVLGKEYVYSNSDTVFIYRHDKFHVLYDFSAQPGDSWIVPETFNSIPCDSTGLVVVVATGDTLINGKSYRYIVLQGDSGSDWEISGKIVEKIGNIENYMLPNPTCVIDIFEGGPLRCYFDDEVGLINFEISPSCDYITGIPDWYYKHHFSVYPNPSKDYIILNGQVTPDKVIVFDIKSRAIFKHHTLQLPYVIDISSLKPGNYFITIILNEKVISKVLLKN